MLLAAWPGRRAACTSGQVGRGRLGRAARRPRHQRLVPLLGGRVLEAAGTSRALGLHPAVKRPTDAARDAGGAARAHNAAHRRPRSRRPGSRTSRSKGRSWRAPCTAIPECATRAMSTCWWPARTSGAPPMPSPRSAGGERPTRPATRCSTSLSSTRPALPDIELHWRVHWYEGEFGARALARAQPGPDGVRRLARWTISPR